MKSFLLLTSLSLAALMAFPAEGFAESPQQLLERIDQARAVPDLLCEVQLVSYDAEKVREHETLVVQVKTTDQENKTLAWFAAPASVKGRKMLMAGNTVFLLFPATSNPIRLSPLQVLVGQASNGDVARTGFAQEYNVSKLDTESLDGVPCYHFDLTAKPTRREGSYASAQLWVSTRNLQLIKAQFMTISGELLKTAVYGDWRAVDGKQFPFKMDIIDARDQSRHTVLKYSHVKSHPVPSSFFGREALGSWFPEVSW